MSRPGSLAGVLRVRGIRELDSRIGFAAALNEERAAAARVAELEELLGTLPAPAIADLPEFRGHQHAVARAGEALVEAHADLERARTIALAARERWLADRTQLAAVQSLVERRADAIRAERQRRETQDLDQIAQETWRRQAVMSTNGGAA